MTIGLGPHLRMVSLGVLAHWCPACDRQHLLHMGHRSARTLDWDHNTAHPTFDRDIHHSDGCGVCHYFITAGKVVFCADSTHLLAGKTVDLPCYPQSQPRKDPSVSYSLSLKAATKAAAAALAAAKLDEVIVSQPVHKVDRAAALANLQAHLDLLPEATEAQEVVVSMHGSVGGDIDWTVGEVRTLSNAGSGCSVSICLKTA